MILTRTLLTSPIRAAVSALSSTVKETPEELEYNFGTRNSTSSIHPTLAMSPVSYENNEKVSLDISRADYDRSVSLYKAGSRQVKR